MIKITILLLYCWIFQNSQQLNVDCTHSPNIVTIVQDLIKFPKIFHWYISLEKSGFQYRLCNITKDKAILEEIYFNPYIVSCNKTVLILYGLTHIFINAEILFYFDYNPNDFHYSNKITFQGIFLFKESLQERIIEKLNITKH